VTEALVEMSAWLWLARWVVSDWVVSRDQSKPSQLLAAAYNSTPLHFPNCLQWTYSVNSQQQIITDNPGAELSRQHSRGP